jgi:uncharacterized membrane protein
MKVLDALTILSSGMLIGVEFAVSAFINPILSRLSRDAETEATRLFARILGQVMPFWYGLCLVLMTTDTLLRVHGPGFRLLVIASSIWATVIVLTILFLVPINNRIARMQPDGYGDGLRRQHERWDFMHRGRVLLLVVAMLCYLMSFPG